MDHAIARHLWKRMEAPHAFVYFVPEATEAFTAIGLERVAHYFAQRSAPMGMAHPSVVAAAFYNFSPALVARALRDVWSTTTPAAIIEARWTAVDGALQRLWADETLESLIPEATELAMAASAACEQGGRPLFAAHAQLDPPDRPLVRLWHWLTLLREYRGDGHVAALVAHEVDPVAALLTSEGSALMPLDLLRQTRGWRDDDWQETTSRLVDKGWLNSEGALTDEGTAVRWAVEEMTNRLAMPPWEGLGEARTRRLGEILGPLAVAIAAGGGVPAVIPAEPDRSVLQSDT